MAGSYRVNGLLGVMDAKGFRHAIPAYMTWCLKYSRHDTNSFVSTFLCLKSEYYRSIFFNFLDATQEQVIYEFLRFIDTFVW